MPAPLPETEAQLDLRSALRELSDSIEQIKILRGLMPMCAWCRRVRNDENYWESVEKYLANNSEAVITHSICNDCQKKMTEAPSVIAAADPPQPPQSRARWPKWRS